MNPCSHRYFLDKGKLIPILAFAFLLGACSESSKIDYSTQIKPILNKNCIHCHGGVKQSGGFSLLNRKLALASTESEHPAIIPFDSDNSELIKRLTDTNPEKRMPFEKDPLAEEEIALLKQWIDQGAEWGTHWAYVPLKKIEIPQQASRAEMHTKENWGKNAIDAFIARRMKEKSLGPNPAAKKEVLLRRLSLDVTGLPATSSLREAFLRKENPLSYEAVLDSLLASPAYGERWAAMWMDLARYADSKGFERDFSRTIWEYRDYVIRAFNQDLSYDQFIIEQMAGDLLENPTDAQYIATGFHRNTTTNDEGGTNNEEFRTYAVINRVNTTWEALMGTTFACTQCHGHPYDPIPHEEYYEFMAFLNNTRDCDTHPDYPWLRKFSEVEKEELASLKKWISQQSSEEKATEMELFLKTWQPIIYSMETDTMVNAALYDTKYLGFRYKGMARFSQLDLSGKDALMMRVFRNVKGGRIRIHIDRPEGNKILESKLDRERAKGNFYQFPLEKVEGIHDLYIYYDNPRMAQKPDDMGFQFDWFALIENFPGQGETDYVENENRFWELMQSKAKYSLIMRENPEDRRRKTHVFDRGNWLVPEQEVQPDVPGIFPDFPEDAPLNRLGLAHWIVSTENPLTARTLVNRLWEQIFGQGLAESLEDLGSQGIPPTHPELLDYLAWNFMYTYNWSVKALLKEIFLSATYRQSSVVDPQKRAADPYNKYYARGPRIRLSAEQIRDQALAVSGLLSKKMYGPPVMPYQPEGVWAAPYNSQAWKISEGEDRYRRALYTFVKRGSPYPAMETFDVANREVCSSRRIRTNTPLQALLTLNDPVYIEAAQQFAKSLEEEKISSIDEKIKQAFRQAIGREIPNEKLKVFRDLYAQSKEKFEQKEGQAKEILGTWKVEKPAHAAAMVMMSNALFNLDEFLTK